MKEWNNNFDENQTECEIFQIDNESEGEEESDSIVEQPEIIKHKEAMEALNKVLKWAENEKVDQIEIRVLNDLKEKAVLKMVKQNTYQKKISDFFV